MVLDSLGAIQLFSFTGRIPQNNIRVLLTHSGRMQDTFYMPRLARSQSRLVFSLHRNQNGALRL